MASETIRRLISLWSAKFYRGTEKVVLGVPSAKLYSSKFTIYRAVSLR